jgi:hypothetical protein
MKLKSVGYHIGITVAIAPYEYAKPGGSAEVELDDGDDIVQAAALARNVAIRTLLTALEDAVHITESDPGISKDIVHRAKILIGE